MTVAEWIVGRTPTAPPALLRQVLAALGPDAAAPAARTADACLGAAQRSLQTLVSSNAFSRAHALALLGIDALTTFAFEHASESGAGLESLAAFADHSARQLGALAPTAQRV